MKARPQTRAVLLDALGTLLELEPPAEPLAAALGVPADDRLGTAVGAEMTYYREHAHEARDAGSLRDLREACAALLSKRLGLDVPVSTLMEGIRFRAFPDAAPALEALRDAGLRLVCVSNWDYALPEVLQRAGLGSLLDAVVTSAGVGARKPEPAIFAAALRLAGCGAAEALHVGDTLAEDVDGARRAGIRALLLDRSGAGDIPSLTELAAHL